MPAKIEYVPMPEELRGKYQYRTEATIDRLRGAAYDAPFAALEDAVSDYVRGYLVPGTVLGSEPPAAVGA